jgi:hypothetical protein
MSADNPLNVPGDQHLLDFLQTELARQFDKAATDAGLEATMARQLAEKIEGGEVSHDEILAILASSGE